MSGAALAQDLDTPRAIKILDDWAEGRHSGDGSGADIVRDLVDAGWGSGCSQLAPGPAEVDLRESGTASRPAACELGPRRDSPSVVGFSRRLR